MSTLPNLLIIDTSYYNFYRFYATVTWYKNAHPEEEIQSDYDWIQNTEFMEKFKKLFIENIKKFQKKFKICKTIFARDCRRENIWRNHIYKMYKKNRDELYTKSNFKGGAVFKYSYDSILPELLNKDDTSQLKIDCLEADDIIYLTCQKLTDQYNISIISSDHDLLQIIDGKDNIKLYNANLKCYNDKSKGSADLDNFCKAILGDSSDNIDKVFEKVGPKTAIKLYNDRNLLLKKFEEQPDSFHRYCVNRSLVDFKYIPDIYIDLFDQLCF